MSMSMPTPTPAPAMLHVALPRFALHPPTPFTSAPPSSSASTESSSGCASSSSSSCGSSSDLGTTPQPNGHLSSCAPSLCASATCSSEAGASSSVSSLESPVMAMTMEGGDGEDDEGMGMGVGTGEEMMVETKAHPSVSDSVLPMPLSFSSMLGRVGGGIGTRRKPVISMGPRADCEKCRMKVPGHWMHFD